MTYGGELAISGVDTKAGNGVVTAVGSVDECSVGGDFDVGAAVLCAIKTCRQCGGGLEWLHDAGAFIIVICGDAIAFFVIKINDRQCGMESQMAWFKALCRINQRGVIGSELACGGIELELVHGVRTGVWHEGKLISGIDEDCVSTTMCLQLADRTLDYRPIFSDAMAANKATTVTRPEQRFAGAIGGDIGRVCANVGGADMLEIAIGVVDVECGDSITASDGNIKSVAVRADKLAAGCSGQFDFEFLFQTAGMTVEIIEDELLVASCGDADEAPPRIAYEPGTTDW